MTSYSQLEALLNQGRNAEVLAAARAAAQADPAAAWPYLCEGIALLNQGDVNGGFMGMLAAIQRDPLWYDAHSHLLRLCIRLDSAGQKQALALWGQAMPPHGTPEQAEDWLGLRLVGSERAYAMFALVGAVAFLLGRGWRALDLFTYGMGPVQAGIYTPDSVEEEYRSPGYDDCPVHRDTAERFVAFARQRLAGRSGLRILEVACGTGLVGAVLRPLAAHMTGSDLSSHMMQRAAPIYDATIPGDMCAVLAQYPGMVELVVCSGATYYLTDLEPFVAGAARVLAPGGKVLFTDYAAPAGAGTLMTLGGTRRYCRAPDLVRGLAEAHGLTLDSHEPGLAFNLPCAYWSFAKPA